MATWYYVEQGQRKGPVEESEIRNMIAAGSLSQDTMVWTEGMANWQTAKMSLAGLQALAVPVTPPQYVSGPAPQTSSEEEITNFLPWSIVVTVLCCMPFGVASIVYAAKANSSKQAGDYVSAAESARKAKLWLIWAIVVGLISNVIILVLQFFVLAAEGLK